jgi:hypothetical protein
MEKETILILGDSASMSVGIEEKTYPYYLAKKNVWPQNSQIINCSIPGFTSNDACAFFFRNKQYFSNLHAVIIAVGHCDAMATEERRRKYSRVQYQLTKYLRKTTQKNTKINKLLYYEWNDKFDQTVDSPTPVNNYKANIEKIIKYCNRKKVNVLLLSQKANTIFPAGSGKGNFIFYHYLGIEHNPWTELSIKDIRFNDAQEYYYNNKFTKASNVYNEMLSSPGPLSSNQEFQILLAHNYAICKKQQGRLDEAKFLLEMLLKEPKSRKEIIFYNLAMIEKDLGNSAKYHKYINCAYEEDTSMYRIRDPYKKILAGLSNKYENVTLIEQKDFIENHDFIDHCHPVPKAQKKIANLIYCNISKHLSSGNSPMYINNKLFNPEYGLGNSSNFETYFKFFSSFNSNQIKERAKLFRDDKFNGSTALDVEITKAINHYKNHPCFYNINYILDSGIKYPSDIGRFPEFFLFRILIPYIIEFEKDKEFENIFNSNPTILRSSSDLFKVIPKNIHHLVTKNIVNYSDNYTIEWLKDILMNVQNALISHTKRGNQIHSRLISTMFWYFRETLRFGSHSRNSMRYDRILLENIAQSLAVALVLNKKIKSNLQPRIINLIKLLEEVVSIHKHFCSSYNHEENNNERLVKYDESLMKIMKKF